MEILKKIHEFELADLGKAPFTFIGLEIRDNKCPDTCKYCGKDIVYCYLLKSSDGKRFFVGSNCILKSGDSGLINMVKSKKNKINEVKRAYKFKNPPGLEIPW